MQTKNPETLELNLYKDRLTGDYQVSLDIPEKTGFRLMGPKFTGNSMKMRTHKLTENDANEIRWYLNKVFPVK